MKDNPSQNLLPPHNSACPHPDANLGRSRASTSRPLREKFGCGLIRLLQEERIQRAKALFPGTTETLGLIADKVGFHDEYHFCKVFKKMTVMLPGAYRRQVLEG